MHTYPAGPISGGNISFGLHPVVLPGVGVAQSSSLRSEIGLPHDFSVGAALRPAGGGFAGGGVFGRWRYQARPGIWLAPVVAAHLIDGKDSFGQGLYGEEVPFFRADLRVLAVDTGVSLTITDNKGWLDLGVAYGLQLAHVSAHLECVPGTDVGCPDIDPDQAIEPFQVVHTVAAMLRVGRPQFGIVIHATRFFGVPNIWWPIADSPTGAEPWDSAPGEVPVFGADVYVGWE